MKHFTWPEWEAELKTLGVRDFSKRPVNKVPNRHNSVNAGGNLRVSSDVLAWMNKLPKTEPRNARVTFYDLPADADPKLIQRQAKVQADLASLGLFESIEDTAPVVPVPFAVAEPQPEAVEVEAKPKAAKPRRRRTRVAPAPPTSSARDAIRRAFHAWLTGRAHLDRSGRNYYVKDQRTGRSRVAPWNGIVKTAFPSVDEFHKAAEAWRSPRNERTRHRGKNER